ncbi:MAG: type IV pilus secretin PilQ [Burkholderiales bacterium]|nr:type IV pilus secretin PilQ [Burkholderiales bacterium]
MNTFSTIVRTFAGVVCAMVLGLSQLVAVAAENNRIEAINVSGQQAGQVVVKVTLAQPLANPPAGFSINNPPRIALDFPNTANALGRNSQEVSEGELRSLNIVEAGGRTRLVLNLSRALGFETKVDGKDLLITLQSAPAAAASGSVSHFAESAPGAQKHSVRDIDFRRGAGGEGRVVIDLSDNSTGIDLRTQGRQIVIDLLQTSLPKNLERRLNVVDFATPVQTVEAFRQGNNTRIVIEPKGEWEHAAYQTDSRFILEVKPVVGDPNRLVQSGRYTGEKLSLNFQNVEVRAVLQVIADFTGLNIITSDTVGGNLTLRLKDVPWDQALDIILQSKGLDMRKTGNVVWIAPRDELATKEKLALEARQQIADLEPTRTESFQLNYQKADDFRKLLTDKDQRILSRRGSAVVDPRTNTVFVQDTPSKLEAVRQLLRQVDVAVRQVMIEARVVEASDKFSRNLGVRLGFNNLQNPNTGVTGTTIAGSQVRGTVGGQLGHTGFTSGQIQTQSTFDQTLGVNLPAPSISGVNPGVFSVILFNQALTRFLNLEISALQADGRGKVISSPRVITADKVEAVIEQGTEIPYQQATSSGATSIAFKKATLSLKVKPQITPDDRVIMNLAVHKDTRGTDTPAGPAIDTKQVTTEVLVDNGGTVVIGGIYEQTQSSTTNKVPVLGDLPYVGFLFKQNQKIDDKSELLVFITPRILKEALTLR